MKENTLPTRECEVCHRTFIKFRMGQVVCDWKCAAKQQKEKRKQQELAEKAQKAADKARLEELNPKAKKKKAKARAKGWLHKFIRDRDAGKPCISCDTILVQSGKLGGDYDAGHFRSVGSAPHMEFVENNIHGQCKRCNRDLHGNALEYQKGLVARYGQEYVDKLLADQKVRKLTIDDYETIEKLYKLKDEDLLAARAEG